jgi:hypothetical protein
MFHREYSSTIASICYTTHEIVGIELVASPEPSYYEREYNSENPWIRYISDTDIVEWEYDELYEEEILE